jgi:hypothetical protein
LAFSCLPNKTRIDIIFIKDVNEIQRQAWLNKTLAAVPKGVHLLNAGEEELKNRQYCDHLNYVLQAFCQY